MAVLLAIFGALTLVGVVLTLKALFPRRSGDTRYCRKCRYNLTGLELTAEEARCPECGSAVTEPKAVLRGERRRRPVWVVSGLLGLLLGLAPLVVIAVGALRQVDWYTHKPTGLVLRDLGSADLGLATKAGKEIRRRYQAGELSGSQVRRLADACLAEQERPFGWLLLTPGMIDLLYTLYQRGVLDSAQVERFFSNLCRVELHVRPMVVCERPCPFRLVGRARAPSSGIWAHVRCRELRVDGRPAQDLGEAWIVSGSTRIYGWMDKWFRLLEPGHHEVTVNVESLIYEGGGTPGEETAEPLREISRTLRAEVEVLAEEPADYIEFTKSPELDAWVRRGVRVVGVYIRESWVRRFKYQLECRLEIDPHIPIGVAFDVYAEYGDRTLRIGSVYGPKRQTGPPEIWAPSNWDLRQGLTGELPEKVTLILKPSKDAAAMSVDLFEIWDGELVFENIPVSAAARADGRFGDGRYVPTVRHPERSQSDAAGDGEP